MNQKGAEASGRGRGRGRGGREGRGGGGGGGARKGTVFLGDDDARNLERQIVNARQLTLVSAKLLGSAWVNGEVRERGRGRTNAGLPEILPCDTVGIWFAEETKKKWEE